MFGVFFQFEFNFVTFFSFEKLNLFITYFFLQFLQHITEILYFFINDVTGVILENVILPNLIETEVAHL